MKKTNTFVRVAGTVVCLLSCFMALGGYADGYVTLTKSSSATKGFAGADWSETVADPSTRDYLVNNFKNVFYTTMGEVVNARSLTLGEVGAGEANYFAYYDATFKNNGITFANGQAHLNSADSKIGGRASFTSPSSTPFRFFGINKSNNKGFTFSNDVHSAATAGILVYADKTISDNPSNGHTGFYFTFSGDTSDYLGSVVVTSQYDSAGAPLGAELRLSGSASYFGGSIVMREGTTFNPQIATSVGSLTLDEGSSLSLVAGNTLTVRTALAVIGGPVPLSAPATVGVITRHALITMPANSACTEADFAVSDYGSGYTTAPRLYMETSGETKTLYGEYCPRITLTKNNNSGEVSAVTDGTYWSDELAVHGSAHYKVSKIGSITTYLSTPNDLETPRVFAGLSLEFDASTMLNLYSGDYTISNVLFRGGSSRNTINGPNGKDVTLRGSFYIDKNTELRFVTRQSGIIRISGPCVGESSSVMTVYGGAAGTSACRGIVILNGDNSAYSGKMTVTIDYPPNLTFSQFMSLRVSDAASLGGPRPEFAYDALKLEYAGRLEAYDTFTMDEPTRGVFISGQGRFYVEPDKTLSLKEQLTVNGRVYKEGEGVLALGGALRFLDSEGELTDTSPADATNRTFYVTGGRIKPLSAHSLDGLDVVFSNKTSNLEVGIAMDIEPDDAELLAKGICNAKSENPFTIQSDNANEKINIALECANPVKGKVYEFAVMTLTNTVADAVFDRLAFTRPKGFANYKLDFERVSDTEAGTKTLRATFKEHGFVVSFR